MNLPTEGTWYEVLKDDRGRPYRIKPRKGPKMLKHIRTYKNLRSAKNYLANHADGCSQYFIVQIDARVVDQTHFRGRRVYPR